MATSGVLAAMLVLGIGWLDPDTLNPALLAVLDPLALNPTTDPLEWPSLTAPMLLVLGLILAPLPLTRPRRVATVESTRNDTRVRLLRAHEIEPEPTWQ